MKKETKVLLIEDDQMLVKGLVSYLENEGFMVEFAIDGPTGFKLAEKNRPDIILLDIILPRMDGFKVLEKLKKSPKTKKIPVIILSNLGQEEEIKKGKLLGAEDFLVKANVDLKDVVVKVLRVLE